MGITPTNNYFYRQQSRIRVNLLSTMYRLQDTDEVLSVFAYHLRYAFMVGSGYENLPPFPPEELAQVRRFLASTYEDPQREIRLNGAQMKQIFNAVERYRVYNRDNYDIVMRHFAYPEEICGMWDGISTPEQEEEILERVLSLIPDAQPPED